MQTGTRSKNMGNVGENPSGLVRESTGWGVSVGYRPGFGVSQSWVSPILHSVGCRLGFNFKARVRLRVKEEGRKAHGTCEIAAETREKHVKCATQSEDPTENVSRKVRGTHEEMNGATRK